MTKEKRNYKIDLLKTIAIIAVVFYHFGNNILPFGYLGVDIFFVVSGYLMMKGLLKQFHNNSFNYRQYIFKKVCRLTIPVLIIISLSYLIGYFTFLPESYKILSENAVATCLFANNIFEGIISSDYWNLANIYKPLMHTWYLGILMQAYILLPLIYKYTYKFSKKNHKLIIIINIILTIISLLLFLIPGINTSHKFYFLPYRLFELTIGCSIPFLIIDKKKIQKINYIKYIQSICYLFIIFLLFSKTTFISSQLKLLLVVLFTYILLIMFKILNNSNNKILEKLSLIGRASLSIYLVHQPIIAFVFSSITSNKNLYTYILITLLIVVVSIIFYNLVEKSILKLSYNKTKQLVITSVLFDIILLFYGINLYLDSGIVRDIPELNIIKEDYNWPKSKKSFANDIYSYVQEPYKYDCEFTKKDKIKIYVIGNSFARDIINIFNESIYANKIEFSYVEPKSKEDLEKRKDRISHADYVFLVLESNFSNEYDYGIPNYFNKYISGKKIIVFGDKTLGTTNNLIYTRRNQENYFKSTIKLPKDFVEKNKKYKKYYGERFIDMMDPLKSKDGLIKIFTDNNKFISWDCRHLTKDGAKYYANKMDFSFLFN